MEREGFKLRFAAAIIDCLIIMAISIVLLPSVGSGASAAGGSWFLTVLAQLLALAIASLEIFKAQSPGKMLLGLVIRDQDGNEASQEVLIKRFLIKWCPGIIGFLGALTTLSLFSWIGQIAGIGILIAFLIILREDRKNLSWYDEVSGTAVYKKAQAATPKESE